MPICFLCKKTESSVNGLFTHFSIIHNAISLTIYKCGENNCYRKWSSRNSFRKHLTGPNHNFPAWSTVKQNIPTHCIENNNTQIFNACVYEDNTNNSNILSVQSTINNLSAITLSKFESVIKDHCDTFVARLYNRPSIPRNHIQFIIDDVTNLLTNGHISILKEIVFSYLNALGSDTETLKKCTLLFDCVENPFNHLKNEYQRVAHFKSSGKYIAPIQYCIGKKRVCKDTGEFLVEKMKDVYGYFIPLRHTLTQFFELSDVFDTTMHYINSLKESDNVNNFIQSKLWRQKIKSFNDDAIVLPIFVYYDDWEVNNPLGSHSDPLGEVYGSIPCLPPECASRLTNIFLVLLFQSQSRKEFGNKQTFAPLIEDLNFLEQNGITITINSNTYKIYFVLSLLLGDNLELHAMCGFVESFRANYACRFCKLHRTFNETTCFEDDTVFRTRTSYATDVALQNSALTGIKEECVFHEVNSFYVTDNIYVDIMHDVLEGIAHYDMIPIISHFIEIDDFTLSYLNNSVQMFDYGPGVPNKPPYIANDFASKSKLKMTASEMFIFCRLFGVIIGHLIKSYDDPFWKLYLLLKEIIEFLQSKSVSEDSASAFKVLVSEHHNLYMKCTNERLKPKHHIVTHYARVMMQSGPLIFLSVMRFEAFHKTLKTISNVVMSRKNIALSIATRHQLSFYYKLMAQESILPTTEVGNMINISKHEHFNRLASVLPRDILSITDSFVANWVNYKGTLYQPRMVLVYGADESSCPLFAEIQYIIIHQNSIFFVCFSLLNIGLNFDIGAFEVIRSINWLVIKHENLLDPYPLFVYTMATGERYVVLHHPV